MTQRQPDAKLPNTMGVLQKSSKQNALIDKLWEVLLTWFFTELKHGHLSIQLPSGRYLCFGEDRFPTVMITLHSNKLLFRLLSGDALSLAEGNLQAQWSCNDQVGLFILFQKNEMLLQQIVQSGWLKRMSARFQHFMRSNSRSGSRRNIAFHYDLGNDFYKLWLDQSMTYSSAYKLCGDTEEDLIEAQDRKYTRVLELLNLEKKSSLLEIGCGWGGMALAASASGHNVHGVTLSTEQLAYAQEQVFKQGRNEQVLLTLTDYRELKGQYDGIISIEMIEAVGEEHWETYFGQLRDCLKPGGRAVLQAITISDNNYERYRKNVDFIQHYIFPGGFLPSPQKLEAQVEKSGLVMKHSEFFGSDYAWTLKLWRREFLKNWDQIESLGFDARFKRMWLYYLDYCEAGFRSGSIDVGFFAIEKPDS